MKRLTNGKKDLMGKAVIAFEGSRECHDGTSLSMWNAPEGKIHTTVRHHYMVGAEVQVSKFAADKDLPEFKTLSVEGYDEHGNHVNVTLFMKSDAVISIKA